MAKPGILKQHQKGPMEEFCPDCILDDAERQGLIYVVTEAKMAKREPDPSCPTCGGKGKVLTVEGQAVRDWSATWEAT